MTHPKHIATRFIRTFRSGFTSCLALIAFVLFASCGPSVGDDEDLDVDERKGLYGKWPPPGPVLPKDPITPTAPVGKVDGGGRVTPFGAYAYNIPLWVPQGRAGMQPSLGLQYSSKSGNGILGVGWQLAAGQTIGRCNKVLWRDLEVDNPQFDAGDNYCLGGQKLVPIGVPTKLAPIYWLIWGNGPLLGEYRTEHESFARIFAFGSGEPTNWLVLRKSGRIEYYGSTSASRAKGVRFDAGPSEETIAWHLSRVKDRHDNEIHYDWISDPSGSATRLLREIRYTISPAGPYQNSVERKVRFNYEARNDEIDAWVNGLNLHTSLRLAEIEMWAPNPATVEVVRSYKLTYETSFRSRRSLLTEVTECDALDVCVPPTTFEYPQPPGKQAVEYVGTFASEIEGGLHPDLFTEVQLVDVNGDGFDDLVHDVINEGVAVGNTWRTSFRPQMRLGSGIALFPFLPQQDLGHLFDHYEHWDPDRGTWFVRRGGGFSASTRMALSANGEIDWAALVDIEGTRYLRRFTFDEPSGTLVAAPISDVACTGDDCRYSVLDFDGDTRVDLAQHVFEGGASKIRILRSNLAGNFTEGQFPATQLSADHAGATVADLDGSGTADVLPFDDGPFDFLGLEDGALVHEPLAGPNLKRGALADVNGDGLRDAVYPVGAPWALNPDGLPQIQLNTGNGFGPLYDADAIDWPIKPGTVNPFVDAAFDDVVREFGFQTVVADFNEDGRDDLLLLPHLIKEGTEPPPYTPEALLVIEDDRPLMVLLSDGENYVLNELDHGARRLFHPWARWLGTKLGDIDGDGRPEIVSVAFESDDQVITPQPCYPELDPSLDKWWTCYEGFRFFVNTQDLPLGLANPYDKIVKVTDGLGATEEIEYDRGPPRPLSPDDTHLPADDCENPVRCLVRTGDLVRSYTVGPRSWSYRYHGGRASMGGRGFLGFERVVVTDEVNGAETETTYDQEPAQLAEGGGGVYPLVGFPITETTRLSTGGKAFKFTTETDYEVRYVGERYYVLPGSIYRTTKENNLLRDESTRSYVYDELANVVEAVEVHKNKITTVATEYSNNEDLWLIGRATRTETTSQAGSTGLTTRVVENKYDAEGQLERTTIEPDGPIDPSLWLRTELTRDDAGLVTQIDVSDANAATRTSTLEYDDDGIFPTKTTNPLEYEVQTVFHPAVGAVSVVWDENNFATEYFYDGLGRPTGVEHPGGLIESIAYSDAIAPYTIHRSDNAGSWSQDGFTSYLELDKQRWNGFDGETVEVFFVRDPYGRVLRESMPRFLSGGASVNEIERTYDQLGRVLLAAYPDSTSEAWAYPEFHITEYTDPTGRLTRTTETSDGLQTTVERHDGADVHTTVTHRGPFGQVERIEGPSENTSWLAPEIKIDYDKLGRRIQLDDPNTGVLKDAYNGFAEPTWQKSAGGGIRTFTYDDLGRLTRRTTEDGFEVFTWGTSLGKRNRLTRATSSDGVTWYGYYDFFGRLDRERYRFDGRTWYLFHSYDNVGRPLDTLYPEVPDGSRMTIRRAYADGMLASLAEQNTGQVLYEVDERDAAARVVRSNRNGYISVERSFDPSTMHLERLEARSLSTATDLVDLGYTYDADGRIDTRTDSIADIVDSAQYDGLGRLTRWDTARQGNSSWRTYDYDLDGRLIEVKDATGSPLNYSYPAFGLPHPHAATQIGDVEFTYDALGREIQQADVDSGYVYRDVTYNSRNLPTLITQDGRSTKFEYDPFGRRFRKGGDSGERYSIGGLFEEHTIDGQTAYRHNVHGPEGLVAVVEFVDGDPIPFQPTYVIADERDAAVVTTNHKGEEKERYYYEPFGRRLTASGAVAEANQTHAPIPGYSGHVYDDELGLINMNGRVYDATTRKFLTPDPIADNLATAKGLDRYGLVGFDPLNAIDPTGFQADGSLFIPVDDEVCANACACCEFHEETIDEVNLGVGDGAGYDAGDGFTPYIPPFDSEQFFRDLATVEFSRDQPISAYRAAQIHARSGLLPVVRTWDPIVVTWNDIHTALDAASLVLDATGVGATVSWVPDALNGLLYLGRGDVLGALGSGAAMAPFLGGGVNFGRIGARADQVAGLAKPGEDLFVGTYSKSRRGNLKSGLNPTHTPHHAIQNAASPTTHGRGITINMRKDLHEKTRTFRRPLDRSLTRRQQLARDVKDLRRILREADYDRSQVNRQLVELIRQNKQQWGQ